jgi:hypothetical protein
MKKYRCALLLLAASFGAVSMLAQGVFIYDQQSATEATGGGGVAVIQSLQPMGQSFIPTNSSVGFIRLFTGDTSLNGLGATLFVKLLQDSIIGSVLGSTDPVLMPDGFSGYVNFFFSTPVAVTPGTTYYFQPVVHSGDTWEVVTYNYGYTGGTAFFNGVANSFNDLWFREGIVVPEPSSVALMIFGGVAAWWFRRTIKGAS